MKKLLIFVLAVVSLGAAQTLEQATGFATSAQAIRFTVVKDSGPRRLEYIYGGSLSTVSTVLKGCMRGDTCDTLQTSTSTSNTSRCVADVYDYYTVTPTFTGGTSPTLTVNQTTGPNAWCTTGSILPTGANAPQVQGVGASGATTTGNPLLDGCAFETTPTTVSTGQTNSIHCDSSGRQIVTGAFASGTASAASLPGMPLMCDTATSGTVTAAQLQMVRCGTNGILDLVANQGSGDGLNNANTGQLTQQNGVGNLLMISPFVHNGGTTTGWDRIKSASLTNYPVATTLTARNSIGSQIVEKGSRWTVIHNPAANSQATASIASEASVRHVVDCVSFSAGATTAPALTALTVNVRDGASGAGTIIWTYQVIIPAATGQSVAPHSICGLNLVGTTATAMTAEFSAGLTSLIESVSISGYNVN